MHGLVDQARETSELMELLPISPLGAQQDEEWEEKFRAISENFRGERYDVNRAGALNEGISEDLRERFGAEFIEFDWKVYGTPTGRHFEEVCHEHFIDIEIMLQLLRGRTVLDVGGGNSRLHTELGWHEIDAIVFNVDLPDTLFRRVNFGTEPEVGASAHEMPIRSESVDVVLSTFGAPSQLHSAELVEGFFNELLRVLNVGGFALLNSVINIDPRGDNYIGESYVRTMNMIRSMSSMPELVVYQDRVGGGTAIKKLASLAA